MRTMEWSVILTAAGVVLAIAGFLIMYMQRAFSALHAEMRDMRADMNSLATELRTDMNSLATELRTDMRDLRTDMRDLRTEMRGMRTEMRGMRTELLAATKGVDDRVRVLEVEFAEFRAIPAA